MNMGRIAILFAVLAVAAPSVFAQKTVIVVGTDANTTGVDKIYLDAMGAGPAAIPGGGTVPGLGYTIEFHDVGSYTQTTFTSADGDLLVILESVGSGAVNETHADDPLPVLNMEVFLADNRTGRSSFYFTDATTSGNVEGKTDVVITDNTHPITSPWPQGQLVMFTQGETQAPMSGNLGSGVQVLANNSEATPEPVLAVADQGATLVSGAPASVSPAPARRAMFSVFADSYQSATIDAVHLFQRVVQWSIGDPVTAGDPAEGEGEGEGEVELFADDFERADSATLGNGWVESESADPSANVAISGGRLFFEDGSDADRLPIAQHSFTNTTSGQLTWSFDIDFARTGGEGTYAMYMQLGDGASMTGTGVDDGVGVNLVWRDVPDGGPHERLGHRAGANNSVDNGNTDLGEVTGPHSISVDVDLDAQTFSVSVDGTEVGSGLAFDNNVDLNTVRFLLDGFNQANFDNRSFDNVRIAVPGTGGEGEGEGEQGNEIISNVNPPFIDVGTTVILTAPPGSDWQWAKDGADISGATDRQLVFDPVKASDAGSYTVTYDDGAKVVQTTPPFNLTVQPEGTVPAAGLLGLAALAGACALGGASVLRRRK